MKKLLTGTVAALAMLAGTAHANMDYRAAGYSEPAIDIEKLSLPAVVQSVQISPSGERIMILKREARDGELIIEIRDMNNLSESMRRLNANPMDIIGAQWITDDLIFGTAYQQTRKSVPGPEEEVYDFATFSYSIDKDKFSTLSTSGLSKGGGDVSVVSVLPKEPDHILIATGKTDTSFGGDPANRFRPANYYKLNLRTGGKELVYRGTRERPAVQFDTDGNIIGASRLVDTFSREIQEVKAPGSKEWKTLWELDNNDHDNLHLSVGGGAVFVGESGYDPNIGLAMFRKLGEDKMGLYEVDLRTGEFGKEVFKTDKADVQGIIRNSNFWAGDRRLAAVTYPGPETMMHWVDPKEKALYDKIERQIPGDQQVRIASRSRDGSKMVVYTYSPQDPGTYYLLDGNKLTALGSRNPTLSADQLRPVEYHTFTSRDGMTIPVYVTKPKGNGPFPTVVMPHGGPHVTEVVDRMDMWAQMLATNGYMVLQPQYRMSTGLGREHFDAGYGEHGGKMQDDKDDAALWAVEKGWADPDRLAMYGFSYGGYAALVAGSRTPQIYQCAIAGAASANPEKNFRRRISAYTPKAINDWSERRGTIGFSAVRDVDNINIPVMMIHGNVDARVEYFHYKDYEKAVKKAGKKDMVKFVTVKDMDHGGFGFGFDNRLEYNSAVLDYLKNDCGPGGL